MLRCCCAATFLARDPVLLFSSRWWWSLHGIVMSYLLLSARPSLFALFQCIHTSIAGARVACFSLLVVDKTLLLSSLENDVLSFILSTQLVVVAVLYSLQARAVEERFRTFECIYHTHGDNIVGSFDAHHPLIEHLRTFRSIHYATGQ